MVRNQLLFFVFFTMVAACGPSSMGDDGDGGDGSGCERNECSALGWAECVDGELADPVRCEGEDICVPELGCSVCIPGGEYCVDDEVWVCDEDGEGGSYVTSCDDREVCSLGECVSACDKAAAEHSNVGCEYWAVDLDNEYSEGVGGLPGNDAAGEQFAVAITNTSQFPVDVVIEQNDAEVGASPSLSTVATRTVQPDSLEVIDLPQREVDGALQGMNEGPGTMLSSRAYRITSNYPVVAYQFNPIIQSFSNGASLLIPTPALDSDYWVMGWPTANPVEIGPDIPGIPDHSFVTVVGVTEDPVQVEVHLGGDIVGGGGIPATGAGGVVQADLSRFDVLNLESDGIPGDLTSTRVFANGPVAVFTGGERALVPVDVEPPPPSDGMDDLCCTEHFEQQAFPTSSLGTQFVMTRSPIRSTDPQNPEGDVYRVLATEPGTTVTTNLPAPYDQFELSVPGEYVEFWSQQDFVLSATEPVVVGQYLVSQEYVTAPSVGGDPEFILFPPAEQFRDEYIFLAPPTFSADYAIIAAPATAQVKLDGQTVNGEIDPLCDRYDAGIVAGESYVAIRCEISDGVHRVDSDLPVGVTVYGYYNVGSYGYAAGAEIQRINVD